MEDDNEDDFKNKEDLHIAGRHTVLDIFRFAVFLISRIKRSVLANSNVFFPKKKQY